jgi:hypothetical protein
MRAKELALIANRPTPQVSQLDYKQAERELTGESDIDPQAAMLESIPESERWDPVPGSAGRQMPASPSEDEDEEGRSESEQLAEEGVGEAEYDQMLQAARVAAKNTRRES